MAERPWFGRERKFESVAANDLGEPCFASLAISRGQIFQRGEKHLYCIGTAEEK